MTAAHSSVRKYLGVFGALLVLTAATVWVSNLHFTLFMAVAVALAIALTKGSLVAAYFMHLIGEHKLIYAILILTVVFLALVILIPTFVYWDDYRIQLP